MKVNVKLLGFIARLYGSEEAVIEAPKSSSVRDVLRILIKRKRKLKRTVLNEEAGLRRNILVLVNWREIGVLDGLNTKLSDGDELTLVPISHGG